MRPCERARRREATHLAVLRIHKALHCAGEAQPEGLNIQKGKAMTNMIACR